MADRPKKRTNPGTRNADRKNGKAWKDGVPAEKRQPVRGERNEQGLTKWQQAKAARAAKRAEVKR